MVERGSRLSWHCDSPMRLTPLLNSGQACNLSTIYGWHRAGGGRGLHIFIARSLLRRPNMGVNHYNRDMATSQEAPVAARSKYEPVIGLEVHVQLLTTTKIFCGCSTRFGDPPNTNVCPVCLGLPGPLPVLNRRAVEFAVLAATALNCQINETSIRS